MNRRACRIYSRIAAVMLTVMICAPASAASQSRPPKAPAEKPLAEQWRESVPVSGGLRVGVMRDGGAGFDPARLTVWLPDTDAPALCVEVSSQDGRYVATVPYNVAGDGPGPLLLAFPSNHLSELRDFGSDQLAILARLAKSCGDTPVGPGDFVVSAWGEQVQLGSKFVVLLNSRLSTSILAGKDNKVLAEYPCRSLSGRTTAFNMRCEIPFAQTITGLSYSIRMRRGSGINTVELPLATPK